MDELVGSFVDEVIDEAVGSSSKKWALLLVAVAVGAAFAFWIVRRAAAGRSLDAAPPAGEAAR